MRGQLNSRSEDLSQNDLPKPNFPGFELDLITLRAGNPSLSIWALVGLNFTTCLNLEGENDPMGAKFVTIVTGRHVLRRPGKVTGPLGRVPEHREKNEADTSTRGKDALASALKKQRRITVIPSLLMEVYPTMIGTFSLSKDSDSKM